jgi:hypothetical protein
MPSDRNCKLWPSDQEHYFADRVFRPLRQSGPHCVSTALAVLTGATPESFQGVINTQDPVSWSDALRPYGLKLAYCPFDVRKLRFYLDELIKLDDLFLLSYYSCPGRQMLADPDDQGWVCSSHVVILHRDQIIDTALGAMVAATDHCCGDYHTKRILRVLPADHARGL